MRKNTSAMAIAVQTEVQPRPNVREGVRHRPRRGFGPSSVIAFAAVGSTLFLSATALSLAASPTPARRVTRNLDIPSQSLGDALQALALASKHQLLYSTEVVEGKVSMAVKGDLTTDEAVKKMLSATDLNYEVTADGLVLITRKNQVTTGSLAAGSENRIRIARSQSTPSTNTSLATDRSSGILLEEVTVSAQRRQENAQEVPISVVVMNDEALKRSQVNSLTDLPQVAPSLNFESRAVATAVNFTMRGVGAFAPNVAIQPGVGLVLDEVPFSRNAEFDVDLGDISSVQFLNGPQGTLFGANNIGGVVLITTPQPSREFQGSVEGTVTSDEEYILRAAVSGPISERIAGRLSLFTKDRKGFVTNIYPLANAGGDNVFGGDESQGVRGKLRFDMTDDLSLTLIGDYRHSYDTSVSKTANVDEATLPAYIAVLGNGDPALGRRVAEDPRLANFDGQMYNVLDTWGTSANLTWGLNDAITLKSITAYRETEVFNQVEVDASPASPSNPMGISLTNGGFSNRGIDESYDGGISAYCGCNALENVKQELRLEYSSERFDAVLGGYYVGEDNGLPEGLSPSAYGGQVLVRNGSVVLINLLQNIETEVNALAAFSDVTWHLGDALDLFAGYRWTEETLELDFYNRSLAALPGQYTFVGNVVHVDPSVRGTVTAFDAEYESKQWAGRAGALWRMTPDVNLYASVSRGFTGAGVVTTATAPATAFVEPTTALSYEIGAKSQLLDSRLRLNVAIFRNDLEDIQASRWDVTLQQAVLTNAGDFRSQGVELDVLALLGDWLTLTANATLMETEMTSDVFQPCYFGQTAAQGCVTTGTTRVQNTRGKPGLNAPELKYTIGGNYDIPFASRGFDGRASVSYTWTDEKFYELTYDPIGSYGPSYGTLDLTLGVTDKEGRYSVSLFGKNVLDEQFITFTQSDVGRNGRARAAWNRGAFAYWGVRARFNF